MKRTILKRRFTSKRIFSMLMAFIITLTTCSFTIFPGSVVQAEEAGQGRIIYVSPAGNDNWSGDLAEPNESETDGPLKTIAKANEIAEAGDTVIIREGTYNDPIYPVNTGEKDKPITYKNFGNEKVLINEGKALSGLTPEEEDLIGGDRYALYIYGKSYITIEGIQIDFTSTQGGNEARWGRIVNSDHITLKNNVFRYTLVPGTSGGVAFINSHYNIITGCTFDDGNDNLLLVQSNYNLIEGNIFTKARHALWCIRAGSYNILRNNYFHNELQKIGEIYDNGAWSARKYGTLDQDNTKHNIVENNIFAYTPHGSGGPYNGIQFAGQNCIIRNNIFYDNCGGGLGMTLYNDEAYYNYNNRIYNNTFVNNEGGGISVPRKGTMAPNYFFYNNIFKNNIIANNIYTEEGDRHNYPGRVALRGKPVQIWGLAKDGFSMQNNVIYANDPDYAVAFGDNSEHYSVSWMQQNFPYLYSANIVDIESEFVNLDTECDPSIPFSANHDFTLKDGSPLIDAGSFLTTVIPLMVNGTEGPSSGTSSIIAVEDPLYFSDGFGIVEGDTIKLQNGEAAKITKIKYGIRHNTIELDRPVTWSKGMGISLYFEGNAPDMGAIETGILQDPPPTDDPTEKYTLTVNAVNGYVIKNPDKEYYTSGERVRLISRPATGYSFKSWEGDVTGPRLIADLVMDGNKSVTANFERWTAPIGIPEPEFGIFETYRMYDDPSNRNPDLTYTQNAEGGYYTHYVDNTHPNATDSNNKYGTAERPRKTIPKAADVPEGSVIELHGGLYSLPYTIYTVKGTADKPIFLRGYSETDKILLTYGDFYVNSQYLIIENIKRTDKGIIVRSFADKPAHHVAVRNCEIQNAPSGINAVSYDEGWTATDVVIYNNYIHLDNFDPDEGTFPEKDETGIYLQRNSERVWLLDNLIHTVKGDAIGGGHGVKYTAKNYYVGRNIMHTCGENAIDLKEVDTVIISQNVMYNFRGWSLGASGTGGATVFHYGPTHSPMNVWFIFNEIFDCDVGIQVGGDQKHPIYFVGNIIHDVKSISNPGSGKGFVTWSCREVYLVGNVFYNVDNGIDWGVHIPEAWLVLEDNIISNVSENGYHLRVEASGQQQKAEINNNLFYQPGGDTRIVWGHTLYNLSDWQNTFGKGLTCIEGDPLFVAPQDVDFHLQAGSPAIDRTSENALYQQFECTYNLNIRYDIEGESRPKGDAWDIGAYEY